MPGDTVIYTATFVLQWGRDRAVPEMYVERSQHPAPGRLQWGRDRAVPEMRNAPGPCPGVQPASMGPGPSGPGNATKGAMFRAVVTRFNGAGTERSRK